jgi:hypothetical protein
MTTRRDDRPFGKEAVKAALAIKARHAKALRKYPNVCGLGVGFKVKKGKRINTLALRVYVTQKVPKPRLKPADRLPATIEGLPVDVIVREPVFLLFDPTHPAPEHAARHVVLRGGISLGVEGRTGTLGGSTFENGSLLDVMLTNWHVTCVEVNCSAGSGLQPSVFDGTGQERPVGNVLRSVLDERVDCAILSLNGVAFLERTVLGVGPLGVPVAAELGMAVQKVGRTTGLTTGTITDIDADVDVSNASGGGGSTIHHEGQIEFEGDDGMIQKGDSGSLLLEMNGNVVGLCYAGTSDGDKGDACHIQDVLNALSINLKSGMTQQELIAATAVILS